MDPSCGREGKVLQPTAARTSTFVLPVILVYHTWLLQGRATCGSKLDLGTFLTECTTLAPPPGDLHGHITSVQNSVAQYTHASSLHVDVTLAIAESRKMTSFQNLHQQKSYASCASAIRAKTNILNQLEYPQNKQTIEYLYYIKA